MTTRIRIANLSETNEINVNEVECRTASEADNGGATTQSHTLKPGESVDVNIYGWRKLVNVLEPAPREKS